MTQRSDALTVRADRTRNHLSELVERLQDQITPAELLSQIAGGYRSTGGEPGIANLLTVQLKKNPLACALIAAGIGWLMMSEKIDRNRGVATRRRQLARPSTAARRRTRKKVSA